jgi:hypothetical protein
VSAAIKVYCQTSSLLSSLEEDPMPFVLWIGLALFATLAVIVVRADHLHNRHERARQHRYAETWATTGLPPGVTRNASGWYSCPRCGGAPSASQTRGVLS